MELAIKELEEKGKAAKAASKKPAALHTKQYTNSLYEYPESVKSNLLASPIG